jgi:hypothetical protein
MLFYGWSCDRASCINGKSRVELPSPSEAICLPLNPMECEKWEDPVFAHHRSAVDAGLDAAARALRAERAADGGVLYVQYALHVSPRAPPMSAQRVGPLVPLSYPQLLVAKEIMSRHTVGLPMVSRWSDRRGTKTSRRPNRSTPWPPHPEPSGALSIIPQHLQPIPHAARVSRRAPRVRCQRRDRRR